MLLNAPRIQLGGVYGLVLFKIFGVGMYAALARLPCNSGTILVARASRPNLLLTICGGVPYLKLPASD